MPFEDRMAAAELLAERLAHLRGRQPLVLAIPRGAVPMGRLIAQHLEGELDVVLVRKLGAPGNPELAVGAVSEEGHVSLRGDLDTTDADRRYLEEEADRQRRVLEERRRRYSPVRPRIPRAGRVVVVVDDGLATGQTMMAALRSVREEGASQIVAATAVAPPATLKQVRRLADDVVCLESPSMFFAVSQFFGSFPQVSDEEVMQALRPSEGDGGSGDPDS